MARYDLRVKPSVAKDLRGIPKAEVRRILSRIEALRDDPRAPGCEKLAGGSDLFRVRQGTYRIVYAIHDEHVTVEVVRGWGIEARSIAAGRLLVARDKRGSTNNFNQRT